MGNSIDVGGRSSGNDSNMRELMNERGEEEEEEGEKDEEDDDEEDKNGILRSHLRIS